MTGTISLAARTHAAALRGASVLLFALLVAAWLVVAARTAAGSARGRLFRPMTTPDGQASVVANRDRRETTRGDAHAR